MFVTLEFIVVVPYRFVVIGSAVLAASERIMILPLGFIHLTSKVLATIERQALCC